MFVAKYNSAAIERNNSLVMAFLYVFFLSHHTPPPHSVLHASVVSLNMYSALANTYIKNTKESIKKKGVRKYIGSQAFW